MSTHMVQAVSGVLVTVVSVYELHKNRKMICSLVKCSCFRTAPSPLSPSTAPEHAVLDVYEEHQLRELTVDENSFFNRYALHEQVLGKGAFSIVKKGSNLQTGEDVAIKVISKQTLLDNELEATRNEASILRNLSHSNIIQALDTFENVDYYFLVQELVSDGDLFSHIENNGSLGEKESQCICRSIIDALSYMHANKICHRDIKPENVLLKHDGKKNVLTKLTDFGFAKRYADKSESYMTTMCGTLSYLAPEVLLAKGYTNKIDCWSLGVVTFLMIGGYQPFQGEEWNDVTSKKQAIVKGEFTFEGNYWLPVSSECKHFIKSLIKINPTERMSSIHALNHEWLTTAIDDTEMCDSHKVFFMIGSQ